MNYAHKKNREWTACPSDITGIFSVWHGEKLQSYIPDFFVTDSQDWEPVKEPLFVTEDSKEVYQGDPYWFVVTSEAMARVDSSRTWRPIPDTANWEPFHDSAGRHRKPPLGAVQFSTEQAAKDWVLTNKPCLSLSDLMALDESHTAYYFMVQPIKMRELAKSRTFPQEEKTDEACH